DPKPLGPQMGVEHAGDKGEQRGGGSDTDSTVDRLRCSFEAVRHDAGEETHAGKMKQRKSDTCSGCTTASAITSVVCAITAQRNMPARVAIASAPAGVSCVTSVGPMTKNTRTSAATDSDHSKLAVDGLMPDALQRITANASCME